MVHAVLSVLLLLLVALFLMIGVLVGNGVTVYVCVVHCHVIIIGVASVVVVGLVSRNIGCDGALLLLRLLLPVFGTHGRFVIAVVVSRMSIALVLS